MDNYAIKAQLPLWTFQFKSGSKVQVVTRKDIETKLIEKAFKENGFKERLIKNPKAEIERLFKIELPEDLSIQVVEETAQLSYVVIPHNPYAGVAESELKAALGMELEEVAEWVLDQQGRLLIDDQAKGARIIAKAWRDEGFRKLLIADPIFVLEGELGEKIGDNIVIRIVEEAAESIYIVIPESRDSMLDEKEIQSSFVNLPMVVGSYPATPVCTKHICF